MKKNCRIQTARVLLSSVLFVSGAYAAPDPGGALGALTRGPLRVTGDAVGGAGLVGAAAVAGVGDLLALIDSNRFTKSRMPPLGSHLAHRLALALSWSATGMMEGLRSEDIERLPEAAATYLMADPGIGRLDTALDGVRAMGLGLSDAVTIAPLAVLRLLGAGAPAGRLAQRQADARTRALGPLPAPRD